MAQASVAVLLITTGFQPMPAPSFPLMRAQQLLARLGYLPLRWQRLVTDSPVSLTQAWNAPPRGLWHWTPAPEAMHALWSPPGTPNLLTHGALMTFQRVAGLPATGTLTGSTCRALDVATHIDQVDPHGNNFALVNEYLGSLHPETLTLWHNGRVVLQTPVNTGITQAQTPFGTFPVYLRYRSQTMSGTTPWGTAYSDPGVPYVNYIDGGVAVHGFLRAAYGFPQSLGCIELPIPAAAQAWKYLHIGTLVTVAPNVSPGVVAISDGVSPRPRPAHRSQPSALRAGSSQAQGG